MCPSDTTGFPPDTLAVRVESARREAAGINSYEFVAADGSALPAWDPGAHIDIYLPSGLVRQYSLCGDPDASARYRVAILELPAGRGGSVEAHRELRPGVIIRIGLPRQNFALGETTRYVFVAGGIGITPLLPMLGSLARRGDSWQLFYAARSPEHFAFVDEITKLDGGRVHLVAGNLDFQPVIAAAGTGAVYCCGPIAMMDALRDAMSGCASGAQLHTERFGAAPIAAAETPTSAPIGGFEVELARSGRKIFVGDSESLLDALRASGVVHPSSCEMGFCGTCEVKVLDGDIDHRDDLLTAAERATNATMMPCVSRAASARLVLDL